MLTDEGDLKGRYVLFRVGGESGGGFVPLDCFHLIQQVISQLSGLSVSRHSVFLADL